LPAGDESSNFMTLDELEAAKHKSDMDDKMKAMIREILFYALLLFFLLIVINGQQDTDSYRQNSNIVSLFNENLDDDVSNMLHTVIPMKQICINLVTASTITGILSKYS